ncbi:HAD family acid phosphatase [Streptomyces corynorhini]|uniref:Secreted acid phosphatase n=1 Tax=Streptomyces corynorhini TaxID=2282652 RepID=A0A370B8R0_9ACTN|nr:HAD family acid phosphatase [Streptomyces corynorhini]RDG38188.1 Secreted acid phosphatase [Streptomyces corynorhini]
MRKSLRVAGIATACAVAGAALYGTGVATARTHYTEARQSSEPHNIGLLVGELDTYYGATPDANGVYQASPRSGYAKDVASVLSQAKQDIKVLAKAKGSGKNQGKKKARPAIVLDIDDTSLLSFDYEKKSNYVYNDATWNAYVGQADRPAVFGMPELVTYAKSQGVAVFFLSGLSESLRAPAVKNLAEVGFKTQLDTEHVILKNKTAPPAYLSDCATAAAWKCTTVQYKAGTRKHIEAAGYDIIGSFGDQYSDLDGGYAEKTYKIPNPTYFVS